MLRAAAHNYGLPVNLVMAIAWQESGWNQHVIARDGGIGVMQLMPYTAMGINASTGIRRNPYHLWDNINLGATYLSWLYHNFQARARQEVPPCHPERSEGSRRPWDQTLRFAQGDRGTPFASGIKSFGRATKGGYSFLCSRRITLHDSEDVSLSILTVGQPTDLGNGHLRESNCSPMSCNFRGDIVNRRDIDRADISDHRSLFFVFGRPRGATPISISALYL